MDNNNDNNKRTYTEKEIRDAIKSDDPELEEAVFPCYGVKCVWLAKNGKPSKTIEEIYPLGKEEEPFPWEEEDDADD